MDPQIDTAQQRAEAVVAQYEAWVKQQPAYIQMPTKREKDKLAEMFQQARREALAEAVRVAHKLFDVVKDRNAEYYCALLDVAAEIDRLREGQ